MEEIVKKAVADCIRDFYRDHSEDSHMTVYHIALWFNRCIDADYMDHSARKNLLQAICQGLMSVGVVMHSSNPT